jgi:hypothetical protein
MDCGYCSKLYIWIVDIVVNCIYGLWIKVLLLIILYVNNTGRNVRDLDTPQPLFAGLQKTAVTVESCSSCNGALVVQVSATFCVSMWLRHTHNRDAP